MKFKLNRANMCHQFHCLLEDLKKLRNFKICIHFNNHFCPKDISQSTVTL